MRFVTENPQAFEQQLIQARNTILKRLGDIQADKTRKEKPLSADSAEQAVELQNKAVLDQLDKVERHELEKIDAALERIRRGEYGQCLSCGGDIGEKRLKALPTATQCIECAQQNH